MVDYNDIIRRYTNGNEQLRHILAVHSGAVCDKALQIARRKNLDVDFDFVREASMLHDIGVVRVNAPSIHCHGEAPYICHGIEGRSILEQEGLPRHALVCERHTGSGISMRQIIEGQLPLPHRDMLPLTLEEKLICYADKFFSKSRCLTEEKPLERIMQQMKEHGREAYARFVELAGMFS